MQSVKELEKYIQNQAVEHKTTDEEWRWESIELNTFKEILKFAIIEGLEIEKDVSEKFLNNSYNWADIDEEEESDYDYMTELIEMMDSLQQENRLPENTRYLYTYWKKEFWGFEE